MNIADNLRSTDSSLDEPASEHTQVQRRIVSPAVDVEEFEYHLFSPQRAHHPLLEQAYEVWRDGWHATLRELDGSGPVHSDEFARQDEIGVLSVGKSCASVTGVRWLDLSLARAREDSYFAHWPKEALAALGSSLVCITSNTIVHTEWRRTVVAPPRGTAASPTKLAFATIALSVRRFLASSADSIIALTRNDRAMGRAAVELGATKLGQIYLHGVETDVIVVPRADAKPHGAIVDHLWARRRQG
jgi:hypothetical protein